MIFENVARTEHTANHPSEFRESEKMREKERNLQQ